MSFVWFLHTNTLAAPEVATHRLLQCHPRFPAGRGEGRRVSGGDGQQPAPATPSDPNPRSTVWPRPDRTRPWEFSFGDPETNPGLPEPPSKVPPELGERTWLKGNSSTCIHCWGEQSDEGREARSLPRSPGSGTATEQGQAQAGTCQGPRPQNMALRLRGPRNSSERGKLPVKDQPDGAVRENILNQQEKQPTR